MVGQPNVHRNGRKLSRTIKLYGRDFNASVDEILNGGTISQREATFCLLDQRTFECHWQTLEKLARYKVGGKQDRAVLLSCEFVAG